MVGVTNAQDPDGLPARSTGFSAPDPQRLWSEPIRKLSPYVPGEQPKMDNLLKLNTNESPFPPSPQVEAAIAAVLAQGSGQGDVLRRYPDPDSSALRQSLAEYHGLQPDQVFLGNGSDEVLAHAFMAFFRKPLPLLFPDISYSFYPVYSQLYGITSEVISLDDQLAIAVADYDRPSGGVILPNPNAPTGQLLSLQDIEHLLQQDSDRVVVIDEAYIDFGGQSAIALIADYDHLLVTQTASKSRGLAGMRVGMAFGHPQLIAALDRVKNSFNSYPMDRLAQAAMQASVADEDYFRKTCQQLIDLRAALVAALQQRGFDCLPSAANFVFVRHPRHDASWLAAGLREDGIIVRHFNRPRIDQYLRITVGTDEQHTRLLKRLDQLLTAAPH